MPPNRHSAASPRARGRKYMADNGMARARLDVGGPVHPRFASGILRAPAAIQGARERLVGAGSRGVIDRSSRAVFGPDGVVKTSPSRGPLDAESAKPPARYAEALSWLLPNRPSPWSDLRFRADPSRLRAGPTGSRGSSGLWHATPTPTPVASSERNTPGLSAIQCADC
jgi:hypothetical protein